jgi:hypothetical protein
MGEHITRVGRDMHQNSIAAAWLRPGASTGEVRTTPHKPEPVRRLVKEILARGPARACCEAGPLGNALLAATGSLGERRLSGTYLALAVLRGADPARAGPSSRIRLVCSLAGNGLAQYARASFKKRGPGCLPSAAALNRNIRPPQVVLQEMK